MAEDSQDVVDLRFPLIGRAVPLDYADALWAALRGVLPWLADDPLAGIHPLEGLSPAEGEWYISGRTRLTLRITSEQAAPVAAALQGKPLQLGTQRIELGTATVRGIVSSSVLYSKFVAVSPAHPGDEPVAEEAFLGACKAELERLAIRAKLVCGMAQRARTPEGLLSGFSLMLSDLEPEAVQRLQREGLGIERKRGCGIFIPHKSGAAVVTIE